MWFNREGISLSGKVGPALQQQTVSGAPLDVVAAISSVLAVVLGTEPGRFAIRSITPLTPAPAPSAWAMSGRVEQHLARRSFAMRPR